MKRNSVTSLLVSAALISGCQYQMPADHTTQNKIEDTLHSAVEQNKAAMNALQVKKPVDDAGGSEQLKKERFNISAHGLPAREFFSSVVSGTNENIVISPDVTGTISMDLKNVTLPEALSAVRDSYGYGVKRTAYGWQILPQQQQTQIFRVDYLNVKRNGLSDTRVSSGQISSGGNTANRNSSSDSSSSNSASSNSSSSSSGGQSGTYTALNSASIQTETEADFWKDLEKSLHLIVKDGDGKQVVVNAIAGVVVVKGMPEDIRAVREFLDASQLGMHRQVVLEAKILEVELSDGFQAGINWQAVGEPGQGKTITGTVGQLANGSLTPAAPLINQNVPTLSDVTKNPSGIFSAAFALNDFNGVIQLLQNQGNVQVLSSPRISTVNNQKAVIKVGTDEFFVTKVSSSTTTSIAGSTPTQDVTITPFFSGIALDVTPQISDNNQVTLHVHPTVSQVTDQEKTLNLGGTSPLVLPLALSSIRESDSIVRAHSNQIVVIGGLLQSKSEDADASVPWLSNIPGLNVLFKSKRQSIKKSELVILLKPVVVNDEDWNDLLKETADHYSDLR